MAALEETINDNEIITNNNYNYITILTDSKFSLYSLNEKYYCDKEYYYSLANKIFILCKRFIQYNKIIRIVKIPAHSWFYWK